jgi:hypothetical protein
MANMDRPRVKALLYVLLRDDLPVGRINRIFRDHVEKITGDALFSDPFLEAKVENLMGLYLDLPK